VSEDGDRVFIDISQAFPDAGQRARMVDWAAEYLVDPLGEDATIRVARLSLWFRNEIFRSNKRRGVRISFEQCDMLSIAMIVAAVRRRNEVLGEGYVRH
jgi:hypothetical protein